MTALQHLSGLPKILNPRLTPLARRLPPLAVLHHRGRKSGRSYDTPVQCYRTKSGFLVGLAYDSNAQWAQNLLAAGTGGITRSGQRHAITRPRRRGPEALKDLPVPVAVTMRALGITEFLEFDVTPPAAAR
jgi:deazaflavin-dependent oxidoreductase (nitroreductase family)